MTRLEFFTEGKPVGHFLTDGYPVHPGRYRYEPYRGAGHFALVSSLGRGAAVRCGFVLNGAEVAFSVEQEVFVPATPESFWFVDIARLEAPDGVLPADHAERRFEAASITCRSARGVSEAKEDSFRFEVRQ